MVNHYVPFHHGSLKWRRAVAVSFEVGLQTWTTAGSGIGQRTDWFILVGVNDL